MLHVLLVDDEFVVRKGIEAILRNQKQVELSVTSSGDAVEALELARRIHFDVIISDISMPEMSGLEMIYLFQRDRLCSRFIIITGYGKLEYAYQAIKLHVADYLLKPINKQELIQKLTDIERELEESRKLILAQIRLMLLFNIKPSDIVLAGSDQLLCLPCRYLCVAVWIKDSPCEDDNAQDLASQFRNYFPVAHLLSKDWIHMLLLNFDDDISESEVRSIVDNINGSANPTHYGWLSNGMIMDRDHPNSLQLCGKSALFSTILLLADAPDDVRRHIVESVLLEGGTAMLRSGISIPDLEERALCLWGMKDGRFAFAAWLVMCEMVAERARLGSSVGLPDQIKRLSECLKAGIQDERALQKFLGALRRHPEQIHEGIGATDYPTKIRQVLSFISRRYMDDITLSDVSAYIGLNPTYLSSLIHRAVGKPFSQILIQTRINNACKLLLSHPDLSVDQISARVGFQTTTYFFRVFKEQIGITPREYQKKNGR